MAWLRSGVLETFLKYLLTFSLMARLDCETVESIYSSLENILGIDRNGLDLRLDAFENSDETAPDDESWNFIVDFVTNRNRGRIFHDSTCWFHATRTHNPAGFKQGIFPTDQMLNPVWEFLYSLVANQLSKNQWLKFRRQVEVDYYGLGKMTFHAKRKYEQGPYGFLIRDDAFYRGDCGHDYMRTPEVVEEISRCFKHQFRFDLQQVFHESTEPCVVKFASPRPRLCELGCALHYLLDVRTGTRRNSFSHCCYPGTGQAIPSASILDIVWPAILHTGRRFSRHH